MRTVTRNLKQKGGKMATHNEVGARGEFEVYSILSQIGTVSFDAKADLCFEGVEIEIKTARPSRYANRENGYHYQFCLQKKGHTNFTKADVLILICLDMQGKPRTAFVIPTEQLRRDRKKLTIPYSLDTRLNSYRERWEVIAQYAEGA